MMKNPEPHPIMTRPEFKQAWSLCRRRSWDNLSGFKDKISRITRRIYDNRNVGMWWGFENKNQISSPAYRLNARKHGHRLPIP